MDGSNSSNQGEDEVTKDGVTIATSNGAFGAAQYRVYKNATLTVSTTSGNITKIELTHNGSKYLASYLSTTIGSYSTDSNDDGTWTGSAASVTFSASSQFRASEIVVTVAPVISDPSSAVAFSDSEPTLDLKDGKTFSQTATTADGYTGTVTYEITANTADATISGSTLTVAKVGSVTVKATAPAITGFEASTATYTLTVSDTRPEANISWGESEVRIALDANEGEYTLPTLTNENNVDVTYSSSDEDVALIDESTGEIVLETSAVGTTTITATVTDYDYKPASVSYTIVIYDPTVRDGSKAYPYNVADVIAFNPTSTSTAVESDVYVKGYIIGAVDGSSGALKSLSESNGIDTNLAISDTPDDTENYCTVQLPQGEIRTALKTKGQTYNIGVAQILVKGNIKKYCGKPGVRDVSEGQKVAEQVKITAAGMATYYTDCALDFTEFNNMYAYTATVSGNNITFNRVRKVPANTGVLLRNPNGAAAATQVVPVTTTPESVSSALVGTLTDINELASEDGSYVNYILNSGSEGLGFYKANAQSLSAHKAYLHVSANAARSFLGFSFEDDATGISTMPTDGERVNHSIYDLQGRRVSAPQKGLYIVNGKKVLVK